MQHSKHKEPNRPQPSRNEGTSASEREPASGNRAQRLYAEARQCIHNGDYEKARQILNAGNSSDDMKNAKGVCLMRLGLHEDALRVFRNLVLQSGTMWMRPDVPVTWKINFCTALLLAGHAAGCVASLSEINSDEHPGIARLREAISSWKSELSLWQKFQWVIGQEPSHPVTLSFPPGELDDDQPDPNQPHEPQRPTDGRAVA